MAGLIDVCRFTPTAGGTADWTYSSAVTGFQSPTAAGAVDGKTYRYRAESSDLSQWEIGYGSFTSSTGVFARTTVLFNSSGTTSKINFSVAPTVGIVLLAEDLRERIDANLALWVATTGSDSNSGRATTTTGTVTFTNASSNIGWTSHGRSVGNVIYFTTTGAVPTNFSINHAYYVKTVVDANTITVAETSGGTAITAGSAGSGTHTATLVSPYLTIQKPLDVVTAMDLGGFAVTVNVAGGTYSAGVAINKPFLSGTVAILGDTTTPSNVTISMAGTCITVANTTALTVGGLKLASSAAGGISASGGSTVTINGKMEYGVIAGTAMFASNYGYIDHSSVNYTISGNQGRHLWCATGVIGLGSVAVTLTGTPAISTEYLLFDALGHCYAVGMTIASGSATGKRYTGSGNAVANTGGGGASFFPGNSAGTTATGAQYI